MRPRIFDPAGDTGSTHHLAPANVGALAQLVERLLCKQDVNGSNPLGSTINQQDQKAPFWFFLVLLGRIARSVAQFTSFREIIGVIGRTRVGVRWSSRPTMTLSKSSTLTKCVIPAWELHRKSILRNGRETYMLLIGSDPRDKQKGAGSNDHILRDMGLSSSGSNQAR